jgi:hypothetical protein
MMGLGFGSIINGAMSIIPILIALLLSLSANIETENGDLLVTENDDELII